MQSMSPGDALALVRNIAGPRPTAHDHPDLRELGGSPTSPGYRDRIPPPAQGQVGDAISVGPNGEQRLILPNPEEQTQGAPTPAPMTSRRVSLLVGRGEDFVLCVEEPPDWESVESLKLTPDGVKIVIPILRLLGIKLVDRTAGDLALLLAPKVEPHAQIATGQDWYENPERSGASGDGGGEIRALRPEDAFDPGAGEAGGGTDGPARQRRDSLGRYQR